MLANLKDFVKAKRKDILLAAVIMLLVLLSFALGYVMAKYQKPETLQFIENK